MNTPTLGAVQETARGFELIEFKDRNGNDCSLQISSLADYVEPGISAVWLECEEKMHLDRVQVYALVQHLQTWLLYGTFEDPTKETKE